MTAARLNYPEVGATTLGTLPSGYLHVRRSRLLGHGAATFERAGDALFHWELHRRAGLTVEASQPVALGVEVDVIWGAGPLRVRCPCRVVRVIAEPAVRGFAYGALEGHPERGEELFQVWISAGGHVSLEVVAFSRPARWYSRLGAPVARHVQRRVTDRYLDALAGI